MTTEEKEETNISQQIILVRRDLHTRTHSIASVFDNRACKTHLDREGLWGCSGRWTSKAGRTGDSVKRSEL